MNEIRRFEIKIEPYYLTKRDYENMFYFKVRIKTETDQYFYQMVIHPKDWETRLDYVFTVAKEAMLSEIKKREGVGRIEEIKPYKPQ